MVDRFFRRALVAGVALLALPIASRAVDKPAVPGAESHREKLSYADSVEEHLKEWNTKVTLLKRQEASPSRDARIRAQSTTRYLGGMLETLKNDLRRLRADDGKHWKLQKARIESELAAMKARYDSHIAE
jgi:hypothetical protein